MPCPQLDASVASESEEIIAGMAPVMTVMPELQELCQESSPPLSMMHLEVDSLGSSAMTSMPQALEPQQPLVFIDTEVLFAKELCDLLVSLEAASPGYGKEIACLLSRKDPGSKVMKVKEFLRSKCRKSGASRKASAAADEWFVVLLFSVGFLCVAVCRALALVAC